MSRRRGAPDCCDRTCLFFSDVFNRDNNDDPGSDWSEVTPDWDIDTNQLVETGTANAKIICKTPAPSSGRSRVAVNIYPNDGDKFRVIVNSNLSATSYQYVEAHCTTASLILTAGGQTRTYVVADGWDISNPGADLQITAIVDEGCLYISVTQTDFAGCVWDNTVNLGSGRYVGLMNGGSSSLTYDGFFAWEHWRDNGNCPELMCYCTTATGIHYVAWKLNLAYYSDDPDPPSCCVNCECFNGGTAVLEYDCTTEAWVCVSGSMACNASLPSIFGDGARPKVWCGEDVVADWFIDAPCCADSDIVTDKPAASLVCDPFAVRWNYTVSDSDLTCGICGGPDPCGAGTYYVIATEA